MIKPGVNGVHTSYVPHNILFHTAELLTTILSAGYCFCTTVLQMKSWSDWIISVSSLAVFGEAVTVLIHMIYSSLCEREHAVERRHTSPSMPQVLFS